MRPEKQLLLDDIRDKLAKSKGFLLTRYSKMDPNLASEFRTVLAQADSDFEVVRKTILIKAAEAAGCTLDEKTLQGHIGVVFAEGDLLQTAKVVFKFRKANEEVLEVIAGRFEGQFHSGKDVEELSKLPSKDEMRAQILGLLEAVPSQLLAVMEALISSPLHCLDNKSKS
jgi:large subunit ribosomal protein L10